MARTRRPHHSAAERQQLVAEFEESGMSQRAFCELHGISKNTLANWRRRLPSESMPQADPFVDLTPLLGTAPAAGAGAKIELRVTLANGTTLELTI
jgi:transposase-like protein